MLTQVARSKGTEWMVSSYNTWQQLSPLQYLPERKTSSLLRLIHRMARKETQLKSAMALSFRSIATIIGLLLSVKGR